MTHIEKVFRGATLKTLFHNCTIPELTKIKAIN